jgi:UDP-glucose 4-epimerase
VKFFVTGATGFIGQRLIFKLKNEGEKEIHVLSRHFCPGYETVVCDLQSDLIPDDAFAGVETVFHLAGFTHNLRETTKLEDIYRQVNVNATVRLAELAVASGVQKFVFVSSVKAGGQDELVNREPEGIYGLTKREAEVRIIEIGRQSEMHVSIVRPSLVYGHGVKGNLALMHRGIQQGWFPPLPETENHRSMIHVDDLVRTLILVANDERANGEIYIATDGVPHSSREIYMSFCRAIGRDIPNWKVPKFLFDLLAMLNPKLRYKVEKLLGNEYYSSAKLEGLGFRAEKNLSDIDV